MAKQEVSKPAQFLFTFGLHFYAIKLPPHNRDPAQIHHKGGNELLESSGPLLADVKRASRMEGRPRQGSA